VENTRINNSIEEEKCLHGFMLSASPLFVGMGLAEFEEQRATRSFRYRMLGGYGE